MFSGDDLFSEQEQQGLTSGLLEDSVRRHARIFEKLLSGSHEGIMLVTLEMNILRVVHTAIGHSPDELIGLPVLSFVHPADQDLVTVAFSLLLTGRSQTAMCECRAADNQGSWRWIEVQMTDLLDDPDIAAILFNYRDITRWKQLEENAALPA
jgi:PAS domain S-box-containing protein